jgi:hypothetical protein
LRFFVFLFTYSFPATQWLIATCLIASDL